MNDAQHMISKAKAQLLTEDKPFYAVFAMRLEFVCVDKEHSMYEHPLFQTMCTDGKRIYFNKDWTETLTIPQVKGVICHEIMHVALLHGPRLGARHPRLWNCATDFAINETLTEDGFDLPPEGLFDEKYRNWPAEKIYDDLQQQCEEQDQMEDGENGDDREGSGKGKMPKWGQIMRPIGEDGKPMSKAQVEALKAEVKIMVQAAAEAAKSIGNVPGMIEEIIKEYSKPEVIWQNYLPTWLLGSQPDDYTWRRPSRKWLGVSDIYMPSIHHTGCGSGALMIDTSGSVSTQELQRYLSEIIGIVEDCKPDSLWIVPCDTQVKRPWKWEPGEELQTLEIAGRGGTRVTPAFEWVEENCEPPIDWGIYFTDLEVCDFPEEPPYPVIWLTTGAERAPWGTILKAPRFNQS